MFNIIITRNDVSKCNHLMFLHGSVFKDIVSSKLQIRLSLLSTAMMIINNTDKFKDLSLTYGILKYLQNGFRTFEYVIRTYAEQGPIIIEEMNKMFNKFQLNIKFDNSHQIMQKLHTASRIIEKRIIDRRIQYMEKKNEKKEKRKRNSCD
jgi:hypothetical protein